MQNASIDRFKRLAFWCVVGIIWFLLKEFIVNNTEKEMISAIHKGKNRLCTSYEVGIPNCFTQHDNEADLFYIRKSGFCDEVEIKVSRSDLLQDKNKIVQYREFKYPGDCGEDKFPHKKNKYLALENGEMDCNYFWYAIKDGIGDLGDIPKFAGLIVVYDTGSIQVKRMPDRLHKNKMDYEKRYEIARKASYRFWKSEFGIGF